MTGVIFNSVVTLIQQMNLGFKFSIATIPLQIKSTYTL